MSSKFMTYYNTHPEYKDWHKNYVMQKIICEVCHVAMCRANMWKHKQSMKHKRNVELQENDMIKKITHITKKDIEDMQEKINTLHNMMNELNDYHKLQRYARPSPSEDGDNEESDYSEVSHYENKDDESEINEEYF